MSPPPEALVEKLVGKRGVGPAGLSAAHRLRLSTQVPRKAQIAVPERPPTSSGSVTFVSRASRTLRKTAALTADEVALLEALEGWSCTIEIPLPDARQRLRAAIADGEVSATRLAKASGTGAGTGAGSPVGAADAGWLRRLREEGARRRSAHRAAGAASRARCGGSMTSTAASSGERLWRREQPGVFHETLPTAADQLAGWPGRAPEPVLRDLPATGAALLATAA